MTPIKGIYIKTIEDSSIIDAWKHEEITTKHIVSSNITEKEVEDADEPTIEEIRCGHMCRVYNKIFAVKYDAYRDALDIILVLKQGVKLDYISYETENCMKKMQHEITKIGGVFQYAKVGNNKYKVIQYCFN